MMKKITSIMAVAAILSLYIAQTAFAATLTQANGSPVDLITEANLQAEGHALGFYVVQDMVTDSSGYIHMVGDNLMAEGSSSVVYVTNAPAGTWSWTQLQGGVSGNAYHSRITINPQTDLPVVAWSTQVSSGEAHDEIYYKGKTGADTWSDTSTVTTTGLWQSTGSIGFATTSTGKPVIAACGSTATNGAMNVYYGDNGGWTATNGGVTTALYCRNADIAIDGSGNIHILGSPGTSAVGDNPPIYVKGHINVGTGAFVRDSEVTNIYAATKESDTLSATSIVLNGSNPRIVFGARTNGTNGDTLVYAYSNDGGSTWSSSVLATGGSYDQLMSFGMVEQSGGEAVVFYTVNGASAALNVYSTTNNGSSWNQDSVLLGNDAIDAGFLNTNAVATNNASTGNLEIVAFHVSYFPTSISDALYTITGGYGGGGGGGDNNTAVPEFSTYVLILAIAIIGGVMYKKFRPVGMMR